MLAVLEARFIILLPVRLLELMGKSVDTTECPKIYRKSVRHLLKYRFAVYLNRCSTYCGKFGDT